MTLHYTGAGVTLHHGNCLDILAELPDESVDAVVTDPPYGLANTDPQHVADTIVRWVNGDREYIPEGAGFMGKAWDAFVPPVAVWDECLRVLKPGGHLLAFSGDRTMDLTTLGIRLAGFDIRPAIAWLHGQGFPKSLNVSKAIDKAAGAQRQVVGPAVRVDGKPRNYDQWQPHRTDSMAGTFAEAGPSVTAPATADAARWEGWGTALKPAFEPVVVARKPLTGTVAANVLAHGTGGLNIDACRIGTELITAHGGGVTGDHRVYNGDKKNGQGLPPIAAGSNPRVGRWPANVVLDEGQAAALDQQSGTLTSNSKPGKVRRTKPHATDAMAGSLGGDGNLGAFYGDSGGASRFFYVAKAPKKERPNVDGVAHPTVKPLALMRWLVRLVTPPGGVVLDPFAGSGTTVEAAILEGFNAVGIERETEYLPLIQARIFRAQAERTAAADVEPDLFTEEETA